MNWSRLLRKPTLSNCQEHSAAWSAEPLACLLIWCRDMYSNCFAIRPMPFISHGRSVSSFSQSSVELVLKSGYLQLTLFSSQTEKQVLGPYYLAWFRNERASRDQQWPWPAGRTGGSQHAAGQCFTIDILRNRPTSDEVSVAKRALGSWRCLGIGMPSFACWRQSDSWSGTYRPYRSLDA